MIIFKNSLDYTTVATLFFSDKIRVLVAFNKENTEDNFYILNKFLLTEENKEIFKDFYFCYSQKKKIKEFADFFVYKKNFYVVFKYEKHENILKYAKSTNTKDFDIRCLVLEKILVKIELLKHKLPDYVLACITKPELICNSEKDEIKFIFDLRNIFEYKRIIEENDKKIDKKFLTKLKQKSLFENINAILATMLKDELKPMYNTSLRIVSGKCKNNVYTSVPQLIIELKKAENASKNTTIFTYFLYKFNRNKPLYMRIINNLLIVGLLFAVSTIMYNSLTKNNEATEAPPSVAIGNVIYNSSETNNTDKNIAYEKITQPQNINNMSDVKLDPGLDIPYEDHIIQYGETLKGICTEYYQNDTYVNCIAMFNSITENAILTPGNILKLPNKTAIANYIASSQTTQTVS